MGGIAGILKYAQSHSVDLIEKMAQVFKPHSRMTSVYSNPAADFFLGHLHSGKYLNGNCMIMVHGFITALHLPTPKGGWTNMNSVDLVAEAYAVRGERFAQYLNGSFVIFLWDKLQNKLIVACDRYGSKPIYYCKLAGNLLFSSEQKAFFAHPEFRKQLDYNAVMEYFTFQNILTDRTFYNSVKRFPAGSYVVLNPYDSCETLCFEQYFDYKFQPDDSLRNDYEGCLQELDRLFSQSVRRLLRFPSNENLSIGAYLSGGVDSGLTVSVAAQNTPHLYTFTCGFDLTNATDSEIHLDERSIAEAISAQFQTEHYEMVLKSSDMERIMLPFSLAVEEPRLGQAYPNYCMASLASRFTSIVLSGNGGDELFGGYPWRYYRALDCNNFEDYVDRYYSYWQRLVPSELAMSFFSPMAKSLEQSDTKAVFKSIFSHNQQFISSPQECINHSMYFEAKTFMRGLSILDDKISMANGIETRTPFLDNDLVDFALTLPVEFKLHNLAETIRINENDPGNKSRAYFLKTNDGKKILRSLMAKHLPESITRREKQGFSAPDATWFRGESADFVKRALLGKDVRLYDFLNRDVVVRLLDDHLSGRENRRLLVWSLLCFENWCQLFL